MTDRKPLEVPPMPEYHDEPVATGMDAEWRHICDLKKWGRQCADLAREQAARADALAEVLGEIIKRDPYVVCVCGRDKPRIPQETRNAAIALLAKHREGRG